MMTALVRCFPPASYEVQSLVSSIRPEWDLLIFPQGEWLVLDANLLSCGF